MRSPPQCRAWTSGDETDVGALPRLHSVPDCMMKTERKRRVWFVRTVILIFTVFVQYLDLAENILDY